MTRHEQEAMPQAGAALGELREVALEALKELTGWYRSELAQLALDRTDPAAAGKLEERQARMALLLSHAERLVRLLRPGDADARSGADIPDVPKLLREVEVHLAGVRDGQLYETLAAEGAGDRPGSGEDA